MSHDASNFSLTPRIRAKRRLENPKMPQIDFETAKRLNSMLTKAHNEWGPRAEPFKAKDGSLGHFVSKITFALDGADPDYLSVSFEDSRATAFIAAGDFIYLATADPEGSSVRALPFELATVVVREAPNVLRSAEQFGFDAVVIDISFDDVEITLPGHPSESNEESLATFFPSLVKHLNT